MACARTCQFKCLAEKQPQDSVLHDDPRQPGGQTLDGIGFTVHKEQVVCQRQPRLEPVRQFRSVGMPGIEVE